MIKNQHVVPYTHKNGTKAWAVKSSGAQKASKVYEKQSEAERIARCRAKRDGAELFIHNNEGRIRERNSYWHNKYLPKGQK